MTGDYGALDDTFLLALIEAQEELDDDDRLGHVDPPPHMTREVLQKLRARLAREEQDAVLALSQSLNAATDMDEDERLCFHAPTTADVAHAKTRMVRTLFGDRAEPDRSDTARRDDDRPTARAFALVAALGRTSSGLRHVPHLRDAFATGPIYISPAAPRVRTVEAPALPGPPELGAAEDWRLSIYGTGGRYSPTAPPSPSLRMDATGHTRDPHESTHHDRDLPHVGHTGLADELSLESVGVSRSYRIRRCIKAIFDYVAAAAGLLILSPLLIAVAAVIRGTTDGPALFTQPRVGRNGKVFRMIKFRTMYANADSRLAEVIGNRELSHGQLLKMESDPRVTPVGRIIRKYSLDEFPQMINVLTGSMSMVGPRPPLPNEVSRYGKDLRRRLNVKPGLTGLWQVSGRSDLTWEEAVSLDLGYVDNWSLALDGRIIWKTFRTLVRGEGAY